MTGYKNSTVVKYTHVTDSKPSLYTNHHAFTIFTLQLFVHTHTHTVQERFVHIVTTTNTDNDESTSGDLILNTNYACTHALAEIPTRFAFTVGLVKAVTRISAGSSFCPKNTVIQMLRQRQRASASLPLQLITLI